MGLTKSTIKNNEGNDFQVMNKSRAKKKEKNKIDPELATKILRTVTPNDAFYFFTSVGQYSGIYANNLLSFCNKLETVDKKSVDFHFDRGDFERWIRGAIGDVFLANNVHKIKQTLQDEELGVKLCQIIKARIRELKEVLASEEITIKHI